VLTLKFTEDNSNCLPGYGAPRNEREDCPVQILIANSIEDAITRVADSVASAIYAAWQRSDDAHVVLSGGRSGVALASALAGELSEMRSDVLHVWFSDERFAEHLDRDRNDTGIIRELSRVGCELKPHRYLAPSESSLDNATARYSIEVGTALGQRDFDAVVLSVGEDGHIASIFPGRPLLISDVFSVTDSPKPPAKRMSLGLSRLAMSRKTILLAIGEAKADVVQHLLAQDVVWPAALLSQLTHVTLVTDQEIGNDRS